MYMTAQSSLHTFMSLTKIIHDIYLTRSTGSHLAPGKKTMGRRSTLKHKIVIFPWEKLSFNSRLRRLNVITNVGSGSQGSGEDVSLIFSLHLTISTIIFTPHCSANGRQTPKTALMNIIVIISVGSNEQCHLLHWVAVGPHWRASFVRISRNCREQ